MTERHIFSARAAERDYFCFTDVDREQWRIDPFVPEQILKTFDGMHAPPWVAEPLDRCIVSICRYKYPDRDRSIFVSLSYEGDVGFIGKEEGYYEKIPGAGIDSDDAEHGSMDRIRQIGQRLYAIGMNGQIYRREGPGNWIHIDEGILSPRKGEGPLLLEDINGASESSIFIIGNRGFVRWFDGQEWTRIEVPTEEWLYAIHVEDADNIWICGKNGTLLRGNERIGFSDVSRIQDNDEFLSIAGYQGKIYLGTQNGVSVYDGHRIEPVDMGLKPKLRNGHFVDAVDGVLWSFGYSDIARFDGTTWVRFPTGP